MKIKQIESYITLSMATSAKLNTDTLNQKTNPLIPILLGILGGVIIAIFSCNILCLFYWIKKEQTP